MDAPNLLDLPAELLGNVLSFLAPVDIVNFGRSCRCASTFIDPSNQILWHCAFLQLFDEPADAWSLLPASYQAPKASWDWYVELQKRLEALHAIKKRWPDYDMEPDAAQSHLDALLSIIDTAKFGPTKADIAKGKLSESDAVVSLNLQILGDMQEFEIGLDKLIHDTRAKTPVEPQPLGRPLTRSMAGIIDEANRPEAASRLHVLHGMTVRERLNDRSRGQARRKVYNWNYTSIKSDYGPFKLDGSGQVNWSLLEGACSIIARIFEMCLNGKVANPQGLSFAIPHRTLPDPTVPEDWARVTGSWLGTYSFLDYEELFAFNTDDHFALRASLDDDDAEAHGHLMRLQLKLDPSIKDNASLKTNIPICHDVPPLYFTGTSRAEDWIQRPMAQVKGLVALVPGGREVRWKFVITYEGRDMWQLEGIQPGGIRSGGVYGLWSHVSHEDNGPVGPFCYFPEELCKPNDNDLGW
jgi:hypothetical protein